VGVKCQWGRMRGGIGESERDFHCVHFHDALAGPPTSWVPPGVLPFISLHPALAGIVVLAFHPAVEVVLLVMDPMVAMVGHIRQLLVILVDGGLRCRWAVACSRGIFRYTGIGKASVFTLALGRMAVSWMEGMKKWRKQTTTFIVVRFRDTLCGPPIPCVPPCVSPSSIPLLNELEPPTSLWKGEGRMQWGWHFRVR